MKWGKQACIYSLIYLELINLLAGYSFTVAYIFKHYEDDSIYLSVLLRCF